MTSQNSRVVLLTGVALVVLALYVLQPESSPQTIIRYTESPHQCEPEKCPPCEPEKCPSAPETHAVQKQRCSSQPETATRALTNGCLQRATKPEDCAFEAEIYPYLGIEQECDIQSQFLSDAASNYIHTAKLLLTNTFFFEYPGYSDGSQWPTNSPSITMVGERRLNNLRWLLEDVLKQHIPGDFIETGVWHGGASLLAATLFKAYGQSHRKVWLADSFEGIPPVDTERFPGDAVHAGADKFSILRDNNIDTVKSHFKKLNLLNDNIEWLQGYFEKTLPAARSRFGSFSVIRLDGDIYQSTWEALENLYPYLNVGGYVIIDDYSDWPGCRAAVDDYRRRENIVSPIIPVYHVSGETVRGVWFQKL